MDTMFTNDTRVFHIKDGKPEYLDGLGVWRIMWHGADTRIILRGCVDAYKWLHNFPDGCILELVTRECGKPCEYEGQTVLYRFENCQENRRWLPFATALSSDELARLDIWVEAKCDITFQLEDN